MSSINHKGFARRRFLLGLGGVTLGLPVLEGLLPKNASAQTAAAAPFLTIICSANGVVQARTGEAESWWPTKVGALTSAGMLADKPTRTTGELSDYADRLLIVRGVGHSLGANGCNHASGCAQILTGAATLSGTGNQTVAGGESVDTVVAKALHPNVEPFFLQAGMYAPGGSGYNVPSYISYTAARQQRTAMVSPFKAYERIVGTGAVTPAPGGAADPLALRRKSVNDVLRAQIQALKARRELTKEDQLRLDQHFTAIRDIEIKITTATLSDAQITQMKGVDPKPYDQANHEVIQRLHMDLMIFAVSSGYSRVAVLQVGDREDDHKYTLGGVSVQFHTASHRTVPNAFEHCKAIDRIQIAHYKYFLDKLAAIQTPTGALLGQGVAVNTNQLATGPDHSMRPLPFMMVGNASGFLTQGKYLDVGNVSTSMMLNTLAAAVGVKTSMGNRSGVIDAMLA